MKTAEGGAESNLPGALPAASIAFLAGAGILALEITGARVFIPWFGSSVLVWSNVIGVTLGAIAAGNLLGGRLADRWPRRSVLGGLLVGAAVLAALVPFEVPILGEYYLPRDLELSSAFALIGKASLLVALLALGPPLVLLGAATPFLVRGAATQRGRVARAAGLISGAATLGSLVGTWAPVYILVPWIGSRLTCVVAGITILGGAVIAMLGRGSGRVGVIGLIIGIFLVGGLGLTADRKVGRAAEAGVVLEEFETRYQYARVERDEHRTYLRLNEGLGSFHSLTVAGQILTGGTYFDYYGLFPPLATVGKRPQSILILGFAAGTIARQILALYGSSRDLLITGVEIDPEIAALGSKYFDLPQDPRVRIVTDQDARVFLDHSADKFDVIIVDTFADQIYVPFQTCSLEFFSAIRDHLSPEGVFAANVSGFSGQDIPVRAIRNTAAKAFGEVAIIAVDGGRNFVLCAGKSRIPDPRRPTIAYPKELAGIEAAVRRLGGYRVHAFSTAERVLTDDLSPIELLADRDLMVKSRGQLSGTGIR